MKKNLGFKNILIVYCNRDFFILKKNIILLKKYNKNVNIYIIKNDVDDFNSEETLFFEENNVVKYMYNEIIPLDLKLNLYTHYGEGGWIFQQILKLYFCLFIKEDYIILDAKNLIFKEINIRDKERFIKKTIRDRQVRNYESSFSVIFNKDIDMNYITDLLNKNKIADVLTPFYINNNTCRELVNHIEVLYNEKFYNFFLSTRKKKPICEFILYNAFEIYKNKNIKYKNLFNDMSCFWNWGQKYIEINKKYDMISISHQIVNEYQDFLSST